METPDDWKEIVEDWKDIKGKPDKFTDRPLVKNKAPGERADSKKKLRQFLPDAKTHYDNEQRLSKMFDKSSRAGAQSKTSGLILPSGQKLFSEFHDKYTGTGRIQKKVVPDVLPTEGKGAKLDVPNDRVIMYERCMDCMERVSLDNFVPNMFPIPPFEILSKEEAERWQSLQLKSGFLICYLFCVPCVTKVAHVAKTGRDKFASGLEVPIANVQEWMTARSTRITRQVHEYIKMERNNPYSQIFFGAAKI